MSDTLSGPIDANVWEVFASFVADRLASELPAITPGTADSAKYLLGFLASLAVPPDMMRDVLEGNVIPENLSQYRGLKRPEDRNRSMAFREDRAVASRQRHVSKLKKLDQRLQELTEQRELVAREIEAVDREYIALNLINFLTKVTQQASAVLAADRSFQLDVLLEAFAPYGDDAFYEDQKIENRELLDLARKAVATEEGRMVLREALVRGLLELKSYESVATYIKHKASL